MSKYAGIVLAGGMSSRFGEPKALASWQGSTFIEHILKVMTSTLQEVVVISHSDIKERVEKLVQVPVIEDIPHYKRERATCWNCIRYGIYRSRLVCYYAM